MPSFHKNERLCSRKLIEELFASRNRFILFPYSVAWNICPQDTFEAPAQVLISTSKRRFHHAVDRNRVKRLSRECYRLHKEELYHILENQNIKITLSISYIHTEILPYETLSRKFDRIIAQLQKELHS